ncbi:hypothetical protein ABPG75_004150 [Micractinium tetrahymenae]
MSPSWTPRLPISWVAGLVGAKAEDAPKELPAVRLQVAEHADETGPALVSPATAASLRLDAAATAAAGRGHLCLAEGSDCVLPVAVDSGVADGQIAVNRVQQHNLHLGAGISEDFRVFVPPAGEPFELADVELEVSLLGGAASGAQLQVDARQVEREFQRRYLGRVLALSEACVLGVPSSSGDAAGAADAAGTAGATGAAHAASTSAPAGTAGAAQGLKLLLRVTATNTLDAEAQEEQLGYHCYRGLLTPETQIFFHTPGQLAGSQQQQQQRQQQQREHASEAPPAAATPAATDAAEQGASSAGSRAHSSSDEDIESAPAGAAPLLQSVAAARGSVVLLNARQRPAAGPSRSAVNVYTSDGEWFPAKRQLLRPCIALTKVVRAEEAAEGGAAPEVTVDVDCLTFDRALIFLEALALGKEPPAFGLHLCPQLLAAAQALGLRPLEEYCRGRLGESQSRLRCYSFEEVRALNAAGGCWLILDGMVLDVTRWLPEHPGGSRIIPAQSLNLDCSRQFELYHASRESFVYLRQFYMGEIASQDRELVPKPSPPPSADFLQQLREYTQWRLQAEAEAEPAARTHLGAKRSGGCTAGR